MSVLLSDGKSHPLSDAASVGGDAELVKRVAEFAEVDIAHFVSTDGAGLERPGLGGRRRDGVVA